MALFIKQNESRSKLQERVATELRERTKQRATVDTNAPDGVTDSNYLKDTKSTSSLAWIWVLLIIAGIVAVIIMINQSNM